MEPDGNDPLRRQETAPVGPGDPHPGAGRRAEDPAFIGPWKVLSRLAVGGMGVVYMAQREGGPIQRPVAVKVVRRGMNAADVVARFERERTLHAALDHPNIARLLDAGETAEHDPYFVMEYVDGLPMDAWCDSRRLTVHERLELFRLVCAAVQHAHANLVVHRDIKPRNVLVTRDGQPKLLDFGIAKLLNPSLAPSSDMPTMAGMALMTPEYASPEQILGEPISTATDVWSLGVLLCELLSGSRPFTLAHRTLEEAERVVCRGAPRLPSAALRADPAAAEAAARRGTTAPRLLRALEGELDAVVASALRREPQRRYASAAALAEDCRRHVVGEPVAARPDTVAYRWRKFIARHRWQAGAALLVVLALAVTAGVSLWSAARVARERDAAEFERQRAERRVRELRELTGSLLFGLHDSIARLAGATEARDLLVSTAVKYLDALAAEAGGDAALLAELASGYQRLGELRGGARSGNRGDPEGALENFTHALQLRQRVAELQPGDAGAQAQVAGARIQVGDVLRRLGRSREALAQYEEALAIRRAQAGMGGDGESRALAVSLASVGDLRLRLGDLPGAEACYVESNELRRQLLARRPSDTEARRDLTVGLLREGRVLQRRGDLEGARERYRRMLQERLDLAAAAPDSATAARDVVRARSVLVGLAIEMGDAEEAVRGARTALSEAGALRSRDAANVRAELDELVARSDLARALVAAGDAGGAAAELRSASAGAIALHERSPADATVALFAANVAESFADRVGGDPAAAAEAVNAYRRAIAIRTGAADAEAAGGAASGAGAGGADAGDSAPAGSLADPMALARVQRSLAQLLRGRGALSEPRQLLEAAISAVDGAPAAARQAVRGRILRAELGVSLAELLAADGRGPEAASAARQTLSLVAPRPGADDAAAAELAPLIETLERLSGQVSRGPEPPPQTPTPASHPPG